MSESKFTLILGALSPLPSEQIRAHGLTLQNAGVYDADAVAISRLSVRGLVSDGEIHRARQRLTKQIQKAIVK